jgi:tripartite-type tricarboxylate transporter receptor subunit TctC
MRLRGLFHGRGRAALALGALLQIAGFPDRALAAPDPVAAFYAGKTVRMLISGAAGSGYDVYARLLARHMGKHIPGNPAFVADNMTAAGGLVLLNTAYNAGPFDGTLMFTLHFNLPLYQATGGTGVRFDIGRMNGIGRLLASNAATGVYSKSASGVRTLEDARRQKAVIGSAGATSNSTQFPLAMNRVLGTQLKVVPGYNGETAIFLAMERGEVDGFGAYSYLTFKSVRPEYLAQRLVLPLVQWGAEREEGWPDVPTAIEAATSPRDKDAMRLISAGSDIGFSYFVGPGVPQERVEALRAAFQAVLKDREFLADVQQAKLSLRPMPGEQIQSLVRSVLAAPKDVVDRVVEITKP